MNSNRKSKIENLKSPVYLVGAGPGDPELITLRGRRLLSEADVVVYAGSLIPPAVLDMAPADAEKHDSAKMTLEQIVEVIAKAARAGKRVVRLASGDPTIFGASAEQSEALAKEGIRLETVPGVSSVTAAAAALGQELTLPEICQTIILTRAAGRTPMPENEQLRELARHRAVIALFLSAALGKDVQRDLLEGGYPPETPVAIAARVTWPDERIVRCKLDELEETLRREKITKTALILVGEAVRERGHRAKHTRSKLYDPAFSHGYRKASV
ncbi:MAG: precorrin-4 C(11)-methyltransferase [Candidatus Lindowbacteria bacterium RIFCSPLOWO2_12_FULL_62_27]|nr:MAG: precorrin-4 C(11)-methyltransferase [Candidatus Lindowbacteria bacterium RIFCSPLOWO2_02_FULL_62_12]OGH62516.1 MAG: precorrin-4 C(11)-methyltransferase [Candidatus Lindowbacteria bacterium RIFCSPLOWO2_12_FULL_62_27]